ncbi:MAG: ABC-type transport auxiliary lipoprotein family protein [Deltaproteobacteria bacterium]
MKIRFLFPILTAILVTGCGSLLTSKVPAPVYYQPEYQAAPVACKPSFNQGVRVWEFSAGSPYNHQEMVVLLPEGKVQFSSSYQWVATPGTMVAQQLARDLSAGDLFPMVVTGDNPLQVPLSLTGRVDLYAWKREGGQSRAVLKVEMSLVDTGAEQEVLFHRIYELQSKPFAKDDSAVFARAMGELMGRLSTRFRTDLCRKAAEIEDRSGKTL